VREVELALDDEAAAELAAFVHLAEVGSTQDEAFARPLHARGALVLVADRQSAGRGRRGRAWQTDSEGALALTVLRRFEQPPQALAPLGPAVGIVVARALRGLGASVALKWPNDLIFEDRKLGGLLIEARGPAVAIGLGLNLSLRALPDVDQPWTDLARAGLAAPSRVGVLGAVLRQLLPALAQFEREGFAPFAAAWSEFDALAGRAVRVLAGDAVHEGEALGIAADGGLRVRHADGERVHHAGEVSVRVAA
jgi:BirA family biotin operon repressor/biotin-[acetyl-CoA-carboxylase] ligase